MAVVKATIKTELLALYNQAKTTEMSESDFADSMADIIKDAILSAEIDSATSTATGVTTGLSSVPVTGGLK